MSERFLSKLDTKIKKMSEANGLNELPKLRYYLNVCCVVPNVYYSTFHKNNLGSVGHCRTISTYFKSEMFHSLRRMACTSFQRQTHIETSELRQKRMRDVTEIMTCLYFCQTLPYRNPRIAILSLNARQLLPHLPQPQ